jgi:NitT/TauT family transport system permease protein
MEISSIKDKKLKLNKVFILLFWILVWQIAHMAIGRDIYVPSPVSVFERLSELILTELFWTTVFYSIYRVILGILVSVILGVVLGVVSSLNESIFNILNPLIIAIKSTPVISFIIIALIWFKSSNVPIFICFLMCFPIIWTNVVEGIRNTDGKLLEMVKVYKVKNSLILKRVYLPSIIPYFNAALITSLGLGWKVSVAAEVLSHPRNSIGSQLYSAKIYLDSSDLYAWTLVVIILSFLFEYVMVRWTGKGLKAKRK